RLLGGSSEWNQEESKDLIELRKRLNEFQLLELHQRGDDKDSLSITEVKAGTVFRSSPFGSGSKICVGIPLAEMCNRSNGYDWKGRSPV
ncbi:hypothetical protein Golax_013229, partial [Gossypium laxum]|nr:hypothetical protein [Gossypium laxum]